MLLPWFFLTPILYQLDNLPGAESRPWLIDLLHWGNPLTPAVEAYRAPLYGGELPPPPTRSTCASRPPSRSRSAPSCSTRWTTGSRRKPDHSTSLEQPAAPRRPGARGAVAGSRPASSDGSRSGASSRGFRPPAAHDRKARSERRRANGTPPSETTAGPTASQPSAWASSMQPGPVRRRLDPRDEMGDGLRRFVDDAAPPAPRAPRPCARRRRRGRRPQAGARRSAARRRPRRRAATTPTSESQKRCSSTRSSAEDVTAGRARRVDGASRARSSRRERPAAGTACGCRPRRSRCRGCRASGRRAAARPRRASARSRLPRVLEHDARGRSRARPLRRRASTLARAVRGGPRRPSLRRRQGLRSRDDRTASRPRRASRARRAHARVVHAPGGALAARVPRDPRAPRVLRGRAHARALRRGDAAARPPPRRRRGGDVRRHHDPGHRDGHRRRARRRRRPGRRPADPRAPRTSSACGCPTRTRRSRRCSRRYGSFGGSSTPTRR